MKPYTHKTLSLTVPIIYSIFLHAAAVGFALTMPIFKGNVHIESYIVHLEKGQASEEVFTAERLAGKKERVRRMATVKALKKKKNREKRQVVQLAPGEKQKKKKWEKLHWPGRRIAKNKTPRQEVQTPVVAKRMYPVKKRPRRELAVPEKEDTTRRKAPKAVEDLQEAGRTEEAVPPSPKPEEEARVEKEDAAAESYEKPGWQELVSEEKETEKAKESESVLKKVNALNENSVEPSAEDKVLSTKKEKPVKEIMSGLMPEDELLSMGGAETKDVSFENPAEELCDGCELVSMLHKNPAEQMIYDAGPPEATMAEAGALSEYSPVDGLCDGCSLFSLLRVNPIEEMIYELINEKETIAVTEVEDNPIGPLAVLKELCASCNIVSMIIDNLSSEIFAEPLPDEAFAGVVHEVTEAPFVVAVSETQAVAVSEPTAIESPEDKPVMVSEPTVIEVPDAELEAAERNSGAKHREIKAVRDSDARVSQMEEILTPRENRVPTKREYLNILDIAAADEPEKSEVLVASEAESGLLLYVRKDVEIRVFFSGEEEGTSFRLIKKTHPMDGEKYVETDITETLDEIVLTGGSGLRRMFSLARAGKGAYSFIMESSSANIDGIAVKFLFHKGLKSEKPKEYTGIEVAPGSVVEIKFLVPEAVFWDDEDYFTGTVESSRFTTKFNDETGLIWKERTAQ
jgi:colicin import membrane protein